MVSWFSDKQGSCSIAFQKHFEHCSPSYAGFVDCVPQRALSNDCAGFVQFQIEGSIDKTTATAISTKAIWTDIIEITQSHSIFSYNWYFRREYGTKKERKRFSAKFRMINKLNFMESVWYGSSIFDRIICNQQYEAFRVIKWNSISLKMP